MNSLAKTLPMIVCLTVSAVAAAQQWQAIPYRYAVVDHPLSAVLAEFGQNTGVPVQLGEGVTGQVTLEAADTTAPGFLDLLAARHGLQWYFDGAILHVTRLSEAGSRLIAVRPGAERLRQRLAALGALDPRYRFDPLGNGTLVALAGPPAYLARVEQVLASLAPILPVVWRGGADVAVLQPSGGTN